MMTWKEDGNSIVTGAIGLCVGLVAAGKVIKDVTSIKSQDGSESEVNQNWRL